MTFKFVVVKPDMPELADIRILFREYNDFLGISLDFQDFEAELAVLPGKYSAEKRGRLYLVTWGESPAGCGAFYEFAPTICEVKRLYLRPEFQGKGIGKALLLQCLSDAKAYGYQTVRLDSLHRLKAARKLYETLGFQEIQPYNVNPHNDVYYMEREL